MGDSDQLDVLMATKYINAGQNLLNLEIFERLDLEVSFYLQDINITLLHNCPLLGPLYRPVARIFLWGVRARADAGLCLSTISLYSTVS
jgi:hypothetical protein